MLSCCVVTEKLQRRAFFEPIEYRSQTDHKTIPEDENLEALLNQRVNHIGLVPSQSLRLAQKAG